MNSKAIKKSLKKVLNNWIESIDDEELRKMAQKDVLITGGAIVSMLNNEKPNDYDVYFKTYETVFAIANYYAKKWNENHETKVHIEKEVLHGENRVTCFIQSKGIAKEENENGIDDDTEPNEEYEGEPYCEDESVEEKPKYRPRYFTTNAISLTDKIQIVIRFYGEVEKIHENFDFAHCTCSYDYEKNNLVLPTKALECIINKELYYMGSKYPLCSIIRTRKFLSRGYHINAGQYVKMALELNELDLKNFDTFRDQLVGVDSAYFDEALKTIQKKKEEDENFNVDNTYLFEVINRIF